MPGNPVLVVGASRGIGAELVRQYVETGDAVHATVRDIEAAGHLSALEGDLTLHGLDVRDVDGTNQLAASLSGAELKAVIHNAGIYRGHSRTDIMEVNADAPIRMAEALLDAGAIRTDGAVVLMSSLQGSRNGRTGGLGDYGDSKAALNDRLGERASEWREEGVIAVVVHPGWVQTDMGGPQADLTPAESAGSIFEVVSSLGPDDSGRFLRWDGTDHPW